MVSPGIPALAAAMALLQYAAVKLGVWKVSIVMVTGTDGAALDVATELDVAGALADADALAGADALAAADALAGAGALAEGLVEELAEGLELVLWDEQAESSNTAAAPSDADFRYFNTEGYS